MKLILFLSLILLSFFGYSQNLTYVFNGKITNVENEKSEAGTTISLVSGGKTLNSTVSASNGKFELVVEAPLGLNCQIIYSKPGFVTKKIIFDGSKMIAEDIPPGAEFPTQLSMGMLAERPNVDFSFLNTEPIATFTWSVNDMAMTFDQAAAARTKKKIDDLLKAAPPVPKGPDPNDAKYQAAIKEGEGLYNQKKYEEALVKYEEASAIKPKEAVPLAKIAEIDKLLKAKKNEQLANQQLETEYKNLITAADNLRDQKKYAEAIAKYNEASKKKDEPYPKGEVSKINALLADLKAKESQFESLKKEGMTLAGSKKWTEAKAKLESAIAIKPDAGISQKIKEIEGEIAKESADKAKNEKYNSAISAAESLFSAGKLEEAKAKYTEASTIDASQSVPKQKIAEITKLIADQSANAAKKVKIEKLIADGNTAFSKNDLTGAKIKFEEVLKEEANNSIATSKLQEINKKIADQKSQAEKDAQFEALKKDGLSLATAKKYSEAKVKLEQAKAIKSDPVITQKLTEIENAIQAELAKELANKGQAEKDAQFEALKQDGLSLATAKKYSEAKAKLDQALLIKQDAAVLLKIKEIESAIKAEQSKNALEEDYKKLIDEATAFENIKNIDGAILKYKEALAKKPTEAFPKTKIADLEKLKKSTEAQNQADAQKNIQFEKYVTSGDKNLNDKKYDLALSDYQNALNLKPNDANVNRKITDVKKLIEDASKLNAQNAQNDQAKKAIEKLLADADKLFKQEKYLDAKALYEKVLSSESDNQVAVKQIAECIRLEQEKGKTQGDNEYKKLVSAADKKFNEKNYLKAKEYYERAVGIRSSDPYPKQKLAEIDALLNPKPTVPDSKVEAKTTVSTNDVLKLEPLGTPTDKSIIDAKDALKKAEIARENAKNKELKSGIQNVNDRSTELSEVKNEEQLKLTKDVDDLNTLILKQNEEKTVSHQDVIQLNKKVSIEQENRNDQANLLENKDHLNIQDKMDIMTLENEAIDAVKEVVYIDKGDVIKVTKDNFAAQDDKKSKEFDDKNIAAKEGLKNEEQKIIDRQIDDTESRKAVEERIENTIDKTVQKAVDLSENEHQQTLNSKIQLHESEKKMGDKIVNDAENANDISIEINGIKQKVQESTDNSINHKTEESNESIAQVVELNKKIASEQMSNEETLQNSTEMLKKANKILQDDSNDEFNHEMLKYLASKNNLNEKTSKIESKTTSSNEKLIEHNGSIKNMTTDLANENEKESIEQTDKNRAAQQTIHDSKNVEATEKPIIANSLGKDYPEGVSQETFEQNDENGLPKAFITRRIVVIGGKGDVYVRTQNLNTITYSKNGSPSTERVWQKETQGPNLVKHY